MRDNFEIQFWVCIRVHSRVDSRIDLRIDFRFDFRVNLRVKFRIKFNFVLVNCWVNLCPQYFKYCFFLLFSLSVQSVISLLKDKVSVIHSFTLSGAVSLVQASLWKLDVDYDGVFQGSSPLS